MLRVMASVTLQIWQFRLVAPERRQSEDREKAVAGAPEEAEREVLGGEGTSFGLPGRPREKANIPRRMGLSLWLQTQSR